MTYNKIIEKFLIEYDKANVTSSYPSLTDYEVATILDKAYLALIGLKVTGNNVRRSSFETDIKSISDLQGLIDTTAIGDVVNGGEKSNNESIFKIPEQTLYVITVRVQKEPAILVDHITADRFRKTSYNDPWIKRPVFYIEGDTIRILSELSDLPKTDIYVTRIKQPESFTSSTTTTLNTTAMFELTDAMAEELISLAVTFALENIESPRLNSKLNMRGLES